MKNLSAQRLAALVTAPYRRGAETADIPLGADAGDVTLIPDYAFLDYRARHGGDPPAPRYLLVPRLDVGRDALTVELDYRRGEAEATATVTIPAGTPAGFSFAVPMPRTAGPEPRLLRLRQGVPRLPGPGAEGWRLVALLGRIAQLFWVLGREKDEVGHAAEEVRRQRSTAEARGASLDLLGGDLRVPRFPPRPHSVDPDTLALYHLDGEVRDEVRDEDGAPLHGGSNLGAESVAGQFGLGFRMPGPGGSGHLRLDADSDFNVPSGRDFTVELFARIEAGTGERGVVVRGRLDAATGELVTRGWALSVGEHRGISGNLRWALYDGTRRVAVYADLDVADGRFHHLAAILDRGSRRARLIVDGVERGAVAAQLGAISNGQVVRVGRSLSGHQLAGTVDELRFSATARADFHPVLGEGDEAYRRRLAIFERWLLPTPGELAAAINGAVSIDGDPASFVIVEADRPRQASTRRVRFVPETLSAKTSLDRDGDPRTTVAAACGTVADEPGFDPAFLLHHEAPGAVYGDGDAQRMQRPAKLALDALLELLPDPASDGRLIVERAFAAAGSGLHQVGRALLLGHETLDAGRLGALAHRAGFDFVERRGDAVFAAVAAGSRLEVVTTVPAPRPRAGDVRVGGRVDLELLPADLPAAASCEWTLVRCGKGGARFVAHPEDPEALTTPLRHRRRLSLVADAPGELWVSVEARLRGKVATGARALRIVPLVLLNRRPIAADGDQAVALEAAVGPPEADFDPRYLVTATAGVDFAPGIDRRLQVALDRRLEELAGLLGAARGPLLVLRAFVAGAEDLHGVGRALRIRHPGVNTSRLAAYAHQAGFGWVERRNNVVFCAEAPGERIEMTLADGRPLPEALPAGAAASLAVRPSGLEAAGDFNWSLEAFGRARGRLHPVLAADSTLIPEAPGWADLAVLFLEQAAGATAPYLFEIRLNDALTAAGALIPKHQYDLVMNLLNYFHPIGVEVATRRLRERVRELEAEPLALFPGYTYPDFRTRADAVARATSDQADHA